VRLLSVISLLLVSATALAMGPLPARAPLISQRFPKGRAPGYQGDSRCGPASVAMVARGFHRRPNLSDAALIESLDRLDDGLVNHATTPAGILRMAESLRLHARVHPGFDDRWLRTALRRGELVVALGRPRFLPPSEAHTGGHFVSIVGLTPQGRFIVNDPYRQTSRQGGQYRVPAKTLASFIRHKPNGRLFAISPRTKRS
jgi:hypothetical protein